MKPFLTKTQKWSEWSKGLGIFILGLGAFVLSWTLTLLTMPIWLDSSYLGDFGQLMFWFMVFLPEIIGPISIIWLGKKFFKSKTKTWVIVLLVMLLLNIIILDGI